MTSALGSTAMKYTATKNPPAFHEAMLGSAIQLSVLGYLWVQHTSAAACLTSPLACLSDLGAADPWGRQVALTVCLCTFFWIYSVLNRTAAGGSDPSIVDRLWSILPEAYTLHWFVARPSRRGALMCALTLTWGLRLTYNFARKGGFSGGEDYRWAEIRKWFNAPGWKWEVFNLVFICFAQQARAPPPPPPPPPPLPPPLRSLACSSHSPSRSRARLLRAHAG